MPKPIESRSPESLEEIATVALEFGRKLMESGAGARNVDEITTEVASGLGAERVDVRIGYASLTISIGKAGESITRMCKLGPLGVNQSLCHSLQIVANGIHTRRPTATEARAELGCVHSSSQRHSDWIVAVAVGVACAAFGRLLGVDWAGVGPIFFGSALAQVIRRQLALRGVNVFVSTAVVAFIASIFCGLGARWAGSGTLGKDMVVSVLLLVPGVPAFNAQLDILEGRPTLGAARAIWVTVILVFMTAGLWFAGALLGEVR